uniref:Uncharacterized protein n=1 Tax=Ditylenchus dipsaci TaxID=166011 RepID=A0A915E3A2_9BILA
MGHLRVTDPHWYSIPKSIRPTDNLMYPLCWLFHSSHSIPIPGERVFMKPSENTLLDFEVFSTTRSTNFTAWEIEK